MKIILAALNSKYVHSNLAIRYLKAYADKNIYGNCESEISIFEGTTNEDVLEIAYRIIDREPNVVVLSCYIFNIEKTMKLCSILKAMDEKLKIVLGGPEVSFDAKEFLVQHNFVDIIMRGEGEITFYELVKALKGNSELENIKSLTFRRGEEIIETEDRHLIDNLDIVPFPYEKELPDRIIYYEASRGCPYNCRYCLSSTIKGVRYFSLDRVKRDLQFFIDKKVRLVKFVDRTFNSKKDFAKEIWRYLIENAAETRFHFEIAADILDEEMLQILSTAPKDLFQFEVGVQSTNPIVLQNINRAMDFDKVCRNLEVIDGNKNIHCHLDLIAGLPGEDFLSFKKSFNDCMKLEPDVLQLGFLKVLKGSLIQKDVEPYNLKYIGFPPYQILSTKDMTVTEIKLLLDFEKVFEDYYSGIFVRTIEYALGKVSDKFAFFEDLTLFIKATGYLEKNIDLKGRFKLLFDFLEAYEEDMEIIKDTMLLDYLMNTKKTSIPDFIERNSSKECKDILYDKRSILEESFGCFDLKHSYYVKVNTKIEKGRCEKSQSLMIFNLDQQKWIYINE